jgi:hypothetical protein
MVEKAKYAVIKTMGKIELRQYPEMITAMVEGYEGDAGFGLLFNYISGHNKKQEKIPMTAPVINSETIDMTSPVLSREGYMAFVMPSKYNKETIPLPLDPHVKLTVVPAKTLAVIRFSGYATASKLQTYEEQLRSELKKQNIATKGTPLLMRYNSPFAPPFLRRNELGVEIDYEDL